MTPLRDYLLDAYNDLGDRRHRDPSQDRSIRIDDGSRSDVPHLFCRILVQVPERNGVSFVLTMHNAPLNADAADLIRQHGGDLRETPYGPTVTLQINLKNITFIRKLARIIRNSVGRGKRYLDCNWKWLCPRTANSLERLADLLMAFRHERRLATGGDSIAILDDEEP
jgi:hypothetical protein